MKSNEKSKEPLPLFEYARQFEDFKMFDDFDQFFTYCLQTSGFRMRTIADWMHLSDTALSIRMNQTDPEQPRFNNRHVDFYVKRSGDPRPGQYLEWQAKQAQASDDDALKQRLIRILPHVEDLRAICDVLQGKK